MRTVTCFIPRTGELHGEHKRAEHRINFSVGIFLNVNTGFTVGNGGLILKTTNSGATWINQSTGTTYFVRDISFADNQKGWACTYNGGNDEILKTTDGGATWNPQYQAGNLFTNIKALDSLSVVATNQSGQFYFATDGGSNWNSQTIPGTTSVSQFFVNGFHNGVAVGGRNILDFQSPPSSPKNLTVVAGNGQVVINWNKNTEADFLKYRIYRGTTSGGEALVDSSTASITDTTKTLSGLTNGTTYYFKVTAIDSARLESGYSNEVILASTSQNYSVSSILWEGEKWSQNVLQGVWFPVIDTVAHFGIDNLSWGQVRTKNTFALGTIMQFDARIYLNSGGTNGNEAYYGFGDQWVFYAGTFYGIKFYNGEVHFIQSQGAGTETDEGKIGTYTPEERIVFAVSMTSDGKIYASGSKFGGVFTPTIPISSALRCMMTDANNAPNTGFLLSSVTKYPGSAPAAPQSLTATAGSGQVLLKWNKNTEADFLKYRIYKGTASGGETLTDSTSNGITDTTRTLTGLTSGTVYYFEVTAIDSAKLESANSNEVSATPFAPPTITSFSPTSGPVGTTVTITGTNFNTTTNLVVRYGANRASIVSSTSTQVVLRVPDGQSYARFTVIDTANGLSATSNSFFATTFISSGNLTSSSFTGETQVHYSNRTPGNRSGGYRRGRKNRYRPCTNSRFIDLYLSESGNRWSVECLEFCRSLHGRDNFASRFG